MWFLLLVLCWINRLNQLSRRWNEHHSQHRENREGAYLGEGTREILFTPSIFLLSILAIPLHRFRNSLHPFTKSSKLTQRAEDYSSRKQIKNLTALCWAANLSTFTEGAISVLYYPISVQSQQTDGVRWETGAQTQFEGESKTNSSG